MNTSKILLILDLDETLIYATSKPLARPANFQVFDYHIYKRPHLDNFLKSCAQNFELAIWSSASNDYVESVVEKIIPKDIPLAFVWGRSRATLRRNMIVEADAYLDADYYFNSHYHYIKRLSKVKKKGYRLEQMLIVDDTPHKSQCNYGNVIYPLPYGGDLNDNELFYLAQYLKTLAHVPNVRTIEKRGWRQDYIYGKKI